MTLLGYTLFNICAVFPALWSCSALRGSWETEGNTERTWG